MRSADYENSKISITTGLGTNSIYYIISMLEYGIPLHSILIQTNRYRAKRESKRLKHEGLKYLPNFIINYFTFKILKLPTTIKGYIFWFLWNSIFGRKLINAVKKKRSNYQLEDEFSSIKKFQVDYLTRVKELKKVIAKQGLDTEVIETQNINGPSVESFLKNEKIDILIISGGTIIKQNILSAPLYNTVTMHNSFLPYLRGWGGGEVWALINDNREALGHTIFYTDKGIDSGDILIQEHLKVEKNDTIEVLRYKNIFLGSEILLRALDLLVTNQGERIKQDDKKATYINRHPNKRELVIAGENLEKWKSDI